MPKRVLVVDDGGTVADTLRRLLPDRRYVVSTVGRKSALRSASTTTPDLIVLGGRSAPRQTIRLARYLQERTPGARIVAVVPSAHITCDRSGIIYLSRVPTEVDLVGWLGREGQPDERRVLRVGKIALDPETRRLDVDGEISVLTPKQARLLGFFLSRPGEVLTRKQIMKEVWETDYTGDTRTLDVHVHWVREKLRDVPGEPRHLLTVRGIGYQFADPEGSLERRPKRSR